MRLTIKTDGASRGNPGLAATGIVVYDEKGEIIHTINEFLGEKTNNEAEYLAFLASSEWLVEFLQKQDSGVLQINWLLDSKLVVEQLLKHWKIKEPRLQQFAVQIWENLKVLSEKKIPYSIGHIPREQNKKADELANQAIDNHLQSIKMI